MSPGDATVLEKLRSATFNLAYWEKSKEVAALWGSGDTSASTVESWGKAVDILEELHQRMLELGYVKPLVDKLYAARVNYGKALEAAERFQEARASLERARQLIPSRSEAVDALRRLMQRVGGGGD
jgi:tetratricopeptide (TPR) repeat protein